MAWEDYKIERSLRPIDEEINRKFQANLEEFGLEYAQGYRKAQRDALDGKRLDNEVRPS